MSVVRVGSFRELSQPHSLLRRYFEIFAFRCVGAREKKRISGRNLRVCTAHHGVGARLRDRREEGKFFTLPQSGSEFRAEKAFLGIDRAGVKFSGKSEQNVGPRGNR